MAFDYNAARANRFAKRHRKVAAKLTGPIESELAQTKEENEKLKADIEALVVVNAELEKANAELAAKVTELEAANTDLSAKVAELEKAKSEAAEAPAETAKPTKTAKKAK